MSRYYPNPFIGPSVSSSYEEIHHPRENASLTKEFLFNKAWDIFQKCCSYYEHHVPLNHGIKHGSTQKIDPRYIGSLYIGGLGPCAYLAWKIATCPLAIAMKSIEQRHSLLLHALDVVADSLSYHRWDYPRCTLLEGPVVGALVVKCLILQALQKDMDEISTTDRFEADIEAAKQSLLQLSTMVHSMDASQCEVLYGRSGYLLAFHLLTKHNIFVQEDISLLSPAIAPILQDIISQGRQVALEERIHISKYTNITEMKSDPQDSSILPLLFKWHETYYLGAAHGMVGILYTLLCFCPHLAHLNAANNTRFIIWIRQTIDSLDEFCFPSSNLNSSIDPNWNTQITPQGSPKIFSSSKDRLVHWCHGATGHILLLLKAFEVFQDDDYLLKAQDIATRVLIPRGLLTKGVGLCHGISGNAYALLELHRATIAWRRKSGTSGVSGSHVSEKSPWLTMAMNFAAFALEKFDELEMVPDRPYSLFEGMAGLSSLLIDLCEPDNAEFPLFGSAF